MNIPNLDNVQVTDSSGNFTPVALQTFMMLFTALQNTISNNGILLPKLPETSITTSNIRNGAIVYDQTNGVIKCNVNGVIKTIQTA